MKARTFVLKYFLAFCVIIVIAIVAGILFLLTVKSTQFFLTKPTVNYLSVIPSLISGTLLTTTIGLLVAIPLGLGLALFFVEYAPNWLFIWLKPVFDLLASIPTVAYGLLALLFVSPFLGKFVPNLPLFNAISPGLMMGLMVLPVLMNLCIDAFKSLPFSIREAGLAIGSSKWQFIKYILIPATKSAIWAAILFAFARLIGETMIVAIASGQQPQLTWNPFKPTQTASSFILEISQGGLPNNSYEFKFVSVVALLLFVFTFLFNNIAIFLKNQYLNFTKRNEENAK